MIGWSRLGFHSLSTFEAPVEAIRTATFQCNPSVRFDSDVAQNSLWALEDSKSPGRGWRYRRCDSPIISPKAQQMAPNSPFERIR